MPCMWTLSSRTSPFSSELGNDTVADKSVCSGMERIHHEGNLSGTVSHGCRSNSHQPTEDSITMNERYQTCNAIVFSEGKIIPFWMCKFIKQENRSDEFEYEDETSSSIIEATWDCKKAELVSPFIIEKKESKLSIGTKVAVERSNKIFLDVIKDIEFTDFEDYYAKYKTEKESVRLDGIDVPEGTKIVVYRHYRPKYIFESGLPSVHDIYVKELG